MVLPLTEAGTAVEVASLSVEERTTGALLAVLALVVTVGWRWVCDCRLTTTAAEERHLEG